MRAGLLLLLAFVLLPGSARLAAGESQATIKWRNLRQQQRQERLEFREILAKDQGRRAQDAEKQLLGLIAKAGATPAAAQVADLQDMLRGIRHLDPPRGEALSGRLPAEAGPDLAPAALRTWATTVRNAERVIIRPLENLFNKAVVAGYPSLAYTVAREVLAFEPEHAEFHRIMGETMVDGRWYGSHEMEMVKAGLRWDGERGWIVAKDLARYEKGEYFDITRRSWVPFDTLQARHRDLQDPWVLRTEHLIVRGTADLKDLVRVADRLEAFHEQVFAAFSGFFLDPKQHDPKLLFGTSKQDPLVVNVARDEADYRRSLPAGVDAGWSAGMFVSSVPASFFYAGYEEAIYHEFTHQIFHVFTGMDRAPAWAVEGIAVYSEAPTFVDGSLRFGDLAQNRKVLGHIFGLFPGKPLGLESLLAIEDNRAWSAATDPGPQYGAAGAFATWCMESDDHTHREDFIDFLHDAYRGQLEGRAVWDYLAMSRNQLEQGFTAWLAGERKVLPRPTWHFTR